MKRLRKLNAFFIILSLCPLLYYASSKYNNNFAVMDIKIMKFISNISISFYSFDFDNLQKFSMVKKVFSFALGLNIKICIHN